MAHSAAVQVTHHKDSDRPDEAFTTEHAKRNGLSNACSGRIRVTTHAHHFGPIGPEYDPERALGLCVGDTWSSRLACRQWGAHMPHIAGIAGQAGAGAQSIVVSGGYEDDKDGGEWLLYTGAGGRDLSGNKRTNKVQSSDQEFKLSNAALLKSCTDGLPVRVLRSQQCTHSRYSPKEDGQKKTTIRYDGIYRIVAAWRTAGKLMCRYLLRRCDNSPAPWDTGTIGDGPWLAELPPEATAELERGRDVHRSKGRPYWDYDKEEGAWRWMRAAPVARVKTVRAKKPPSKKKEEKTGGREGTRGNNQPSPLKGRPLQSPVSVPAGDKNPPKVGLLTCDDSDFEDDEDEILPCRKRGKVHSKKQAGG